MAQPNITNFVLKRPWLKRWMMPLASWYCDAAGYRKLGLRSEILPVREIQLGATDNDLEPMILFRKKMKPCSWLSKDCRPRKLTIVFSGFGELSRYKGSSYHHIISITDTKRYPVTGFPITSIAAQVRTNQARGGTVSTIFEFWNASI